MWQLEHLAEKNRNRRSITAMWKGFFEESNCFKSCSGLGYYFITR